MKVLVAPAEFSISAHNYHVSYNLVKRINEDFYVLINKVKSEVKKKVKNANFYELNTSFMLYPFKIWLKGRRLSKNVDLIHHLSPFAVGKDFNLLCLSTSIPFLVGPAEVPHKFFEDELKMWNVPGFAGLIEHSTLRQNLSIKTLEKSSGIVAVNNQTKRYLSEFIEKNRIWIIPIGVNVDLFKSFPSPRGNDILTVGRHIKRKGFNYLIEAMPKIMKEAPEARLHITSNGPQTPNLKNLVKRLGLNDNVIFHGRVSDERILQLYRQCRVFCHPSLSEGFCHTTLEAMASGKPVVSTNTAGSEMVEHKKTGFLVPIGDSDAMVDAILKVLESDTLAQKMGIKARRKVEEVYDWDIISKKYHEVYKKLTE